MNRRQFMVLAGAASVIGLGKLAQPNELLAKALVPATRRKIYRGTKDGKLFESFNDGENWNQIANFGEQCAIEQIDMRSLDGRITLHLRYQNHPFRLKSQDGYTWHTV